MKYIFILLVTLSFMNCKSSTAQQTTQGIKGQVLWYEGNLMPGPGSKATEGKPVKREVFIYELTSMSAAVSEEQLYKDIPSELVKVTETDKNGNFSVSLPPGRYSVFTKENEGFFANIFDGEGHINPVTVKTGEITEITIKINYKAVY